MIRCGGLLWLWLALGLPAGAQFDGPGATGVSASLIRLFGTNSAFTAQAEVRVLGRDQTPQLTTLMTFTLTDNKIRVEVDMNRMQNRAQPDALAQVKPLGMEQVISILRPEQRAIFILFPKLNAHVRLEQSAAEAEAFLKPAQLQRTVMGKEKMAGYDCVKQRVVITEGGGKKSEATVWVAPELRNFPVCVATQEKTGTVAVQFRKVQFTRAEAGRFEPPPGSTACADLQVLMAGPVVKYMRANQTTVRMPAKAAARKPALAGATPKPASARTNAPPSKKK